MLFYYLIFFFVTVVAKLILAAVMIYLLLPTDRRCSDCDEETLLLEDHLIVRLAMRFTPGRLQRRWCPRCGEEAFCRPPLGQRVAPHQVGHRILIHVHDDNHK